MQEWRLVNGVQRLLELQKKKCPYKVVTVTLPNDDGEKNEVELYFTLQNV